LNRLSSRTISNAVVLLGQREDRLGTIRAEPLQVGFALFRIERGPQHAKITRRPGIGRSLATGARPAR
jgi:hypothetical protein